MMKFVQLDTESMWALSGLSWVRGGGGFRLKKVGFLCGGSFGSKKMLFVVWKCCNT